MGYQVPAKASHKGNRGMLHSSAPTKLGMAVFFIGIWIRLKLVGKQIHNIYRNWGSGLCIGKIFRIYIIYYIKRISIIGHSVRINSIIGNSNNDEVSRNRILMTKMGRLIISRSEERRVGKEGSYR